ncbi:MAG: hypothetical protein GXN94_01275 [Aquificae bacterium]|nr:hypothetical protein [Aquificota bacterium]
MDAQTFFLGVIAVCMVIMTLGFIVMSIVTTILLKNIVSLLIRINMDYKVISPKIHRILENVEYTTSILSVFSIVRRRKK